MGLHENKVELLRNIEIFSQLREYELDIIAKYSDITEFKKKSVIFSHGTPAEELFVVDKGRVGIISLEDQDDVVIAQIIAGESFGELDFLGKTPRSATALAEEDTALLQFPAKKYKAEEIFHENPYISAQMLYRLFGIISERAWRVTNMLYDKTRWLQDLHKQLLCDKMTGLYNQTFLKEDFINLLHVGQSAAVLMIKPDNFKEINDNYGHEAGDHVLNIMAIFLQSELGENDIGVRYMGDEFAAILVDAEKDDAIRKAKEISNAFKSMNLSRVINSDSLKLKVSIGIALYPENADNSKKLVDLAKKRMLNARAAGGSCIIV